MRGRGEWWKEGRGGEEGEFLGGCEEWVEKK